MAKIHHLNIDRAINTFLRNVEGLSYLPFITDAEMTLLYGEEVTDSLAELARENIKIEICSHCQQKCCPLVKCELYDPGFSQCPVFEYRPPLCRMHFCDKFPIGDVSFIREFADIFLNSIIESQRQGSQKAALFDCPPLSRLAPEFVKNTSPWISAFKQGKMDEITVLTLIRAEVEKYGLEK
jgi:hypothetical protein